LSQGRKKAAKKVQKSSEFANGVLHSSFASSTIIVLNR
jgi:hypothetical protein